MELLLPNKVVVPLDEVCQYHSTPDGGLLLR